MANKIKLNIDKLLSRIITMKNDGMQTVEITIMDSESFLGDIYPKTALLEAYDNKTNASYGYNAIEEDIED